ncbi:MAG: SPFH domain-containing protein [Phycisphaerales bacterium]
MQLIIRIIVTALIVLGIIGFMTSYTVRFTETAVVTTFGRADGSSVVKEAGLYAKWPYPIQSVTRYDTRARFVESRPETQQTADNRQIILTAYVTYRVDDAMSFYRLFSKQGSSPTKHFEAAETILSSRLRDAMSETAKFRFDDLFSQGADGTGLIKLEERIKAQLNTDATGRSMKDYGIQILTVGISSTKLPEETSKAVAQRMAQTRQKLAQEAVSRGEAERNKIKSGAEADAQKIMDFASRRARTIQAQGELEAKKYVDRQKDNPELAVFLKNVELVRDAMSRKFTLVLPVSMPGMSLFTPEALEQLRTGKVPGATLPPATPVPSPATPARSGAAPAQPADTASASEGGNQ